jgi:hypothetical protein
MASKYPRTLYKRSENGKFDFTNKKHRHIKYDSLVVESEEEHRVAEQEMGYIDSFEGALFHAPEKKAVEVVEDEEDF